MYSLIKRKIHNTNELIRETAAELALPEDLVRSVIEYQFASLVNFCNYPSKAGFTFEGLGRFIIYPRALEAFRAYVRRNKYRPELRESLISKFLRVLKIRHAVIELNKSSHKKQWLKKQSYLNPSNPPSKAN